MFLSGLLFMGCVFSWERRLALRSYLPPITLAQGVRKPAPLKTIVFQAALVHPSVVEEKERVVKLRESVGLETVIPV